jgi:hypothetical protein
MPSSDRDLSRKGKVITAKHRTAHCDRDREGLVVRITNADDERIVLGRAAIRYLEQPKIPQAVRPQGVRLIRYL